MDDRLPFHPSEPGTHSAPPQIRWRRRNAPAPIELHAGIERERSALAEHWRQLCAEMERIDRRLEELDSLLLGF